MFTTDYEQILALVHKINPIAYCKTRNYGNGAVTKLSPYISRGIISTKQVLDIVLAKGFAIKDIEQFVKELCWRDYFQRVAQHHRQAMLNDTGRSQDGVWHHEMPSAVNHANIGIAAIDDAIQALYNTGYMHNHMRMYVASIVTNIAKSHWQLPSKWLYYHLLDADFASNTCSWQWVCAVRSNKRYYANQENINKYFASAQSSTFLDVPYEMFENMAVPQVLQQTENLHFETKLPAQASIQIDTSKPTCIYNIYNLEPLWRNGEDCNRVLLLEPSHFATHPVSEKTIEFVLALAKNIPNLQVLVSEFADLQKRCGSQTIYFKEHPLFTHYLGHKDSRDWIAPEVDGDYPSFFAYWKRLERVLG
jgi:deoxyribodipyrimidine photo-lyase